MADQAARADDQAALAIAACAQFLQMAIIHIGRVDAKATPICHDAIMDGDILSAARHGYPAAGTSGPIQGKAVQVEVHGIGRYIDAVGAS